MHFFAWPKAGCLSLNGGPGKTSASCSNEDFTPKPLSELCVVLDSPTMITDDAKLADAAALAKEVMANYTTTQFDASDIWRVRFSSALPATVSTLTQASVVLTCVGRCGPHGTHESFATTVFKLRARACV